MSEQPTMRQRAETLLENTKRLRFFKGQVYDGGADEYLRQLHGFLQDYINGPAKPDRPAKSYEYTGYLKEHLPMILKLLRMGQTPHEVEQTLSNVRGVPFASSYWGGSPAPMIRYIAKRYGIGLAAYEPSPHRQRNAEIAAKYLAGGTTLADLGRAYGLSRERIRGIVFKVEREMRNRDEAATAYRAAARIEDIPLAVADLDVRTKNCLHNMGCETVGDAMKRKDSELLREPNFGRTSLRDWRRYLDELPKKMAEAKEIA